LLIDQLKLQLEEKSILFGVFLRILDCEVNGLKQKKSLAPEEDSLKSSTRNKSQASKVPPLLDQSHTPTSGMQPLSELRISTTPNRFRSNTVRSSREEKDFKGSRSTRNKDDPSPIDLKYIKHMEEMSEKLNEIKKNTKKISKKEDVNSDL
jgi:hypothetical protein